MCTDYGFYQRGGLHAFFAYEEERDVQSSINIISFLDSWFPRFSWWGVHNALSVMKAFHITTMNETGTGWFPPLPFITGTSWPRDKLWLSSGTCFRSHPSSASHNEFPHSHSWCNHSAWLDNATSLLWVPRFIKMNIFYRWRIEVNDHRQSVSNCWTRKRTSGAGKSDTWGGATWRGKKSPTLRSASSYSYSSYVGTLRAPPLSRDTKGTSIHARSIPVFSGIKTNHQPAKLIQILRNEALYEYQLSPQPASPETMT